MVCIYCAAVINEQDEYMVPNKSVAASPAQWQQAHVKCYQEHMRKKGR